MHNKLLQQVIRKMKRRQLILAPEYVPKKQKRSVGTTTTKSVSVGTNTTNFTTGYTAQDTRFKAIGTDIIRRRVLAGYNPRDDFELPKIFNKLKSLGIFVTKQTNAHAYFLKHDAELKNY
jgi:hypothetical protein